MILQYVAASLVSENKTFAHPASVDSIPSSANQEDHVSMGTIAARHAAEIVRNTYKVLAIELICSMQALEYRGVEKASPKTAALYEAGRKVVPSMTEDRVLRRISNGRRRGCRRMCLVGRNGEKGEIPVAEARKVRAKTGRGLECKGWEQEAVLRMLCNNLDPDVAERPEDLVVYGGIGKAARNWEAFDAIVSTLKRLEKDETMLVQSGKPVGVFRTHEQAPRVLLANSVLVPKWADWDTFHELDRKGLMMYGQMTAGSWIYIGSQGILQGTYETFASLAEQHFGGSLQGTITWTAGLGGMGGAQPLAVTMNGGVVVAVEVDETRIDKRIATGYCDRKTASLTEALKWAEEAKRAGRPLSIALLANAADVYPSLINRKEEIDILTDQTSAHDPLNGYIPKGWSLEKAAELRKEDPERYVELSSRSMADHVTSMLHFQKEGTIVFDYGNNIRQVAYDQGVKDAFAFPGFVPAYIRPLFCEGKDRSAGRRSPGIRQISNGRMIF